MSTQLLCARLGVLHQLLLTVCDQRAQDPKSVLKNLIATELSRSGDQGPVTKTSHERIRFVAGELQTQFVRHCKQRGVAASAMLSHLVQQELQRTLSNASCSSDESTPNAHEVRITIGVPDKQRVRVELHMPQSELDAIRSIAQKRHATPQQLINQIVRAFLLKSPAFGQEEITALGAINLALKRIGNNLNQIARHINAQESAASESSDAHAQVIRCVDEINAHVLGCANFLQLSREKWRIELRS